jgi:polysaccharide biosynthesis protein PelA
MFIRLLLLFVVASLAACPAGAAFQWAVCYSGNAAVEEFHDFSLVVLDSDTHPPLDLLHRRGRDLLGYLSLGEVERHRPYFAAVQAEGLLLGENPNWHGSFYVDFRDERWRQRVIRQLVPALLAAGFNGVFLDTLDDAAGLERDHPEAFRGMTQAASELVRSLRAAFPHIRIMVNRGYDLLSGIAPSIDFLLGESVYSTYDSPHGYARAPAAQYQEQVRLMRQARRWNPRLRICSLDYWDPADSKEIRHIYQVERANGFAPYVSTRELDHIVKAP